MLCRLALATSLVLASAGCSTVTPARLAVTAKAGDKPANTGTTGNGSAQQPNAQPGAGPDAQLEAPVALPAPSGGSGGGSSNTATFDRYQPLREVADMFSFKNPRVERAAGSLGEVAGIALSSGVLGNAGASVISNNGAGLVSDHGAGYRVMSRSRVPQSLYRVLSDPATLIVADPVTRELQAVVSEDVVLGFAFNNQGRTRTWTAVVAEATDASTGGVQFTVTGDWEPAAPPDEDPGYKLFGGEVPTAIETFGALLDFTPAGDANSRLQTTAQVSGFDTKAGLTLPAMPGHVTAQATIADLVVSAQTQYAEQAGKAVLTARSTLTGNVLSGAETLTIDYKLDENTLKQDVTVTSTLARAKFTFTSKVALPDAPAVPASELTAPLIATDNGVTLGTVTWHPDHGTRVTVKLNDGRQFDWELLGQLFAPVTPES